MLLNTRFMTASRRWVWYTCTIRLKEIVHYATEENPRDTYDDLGLFQHFTEVSNVFNDDLQYSTLTEIIFFIFFL